MAEISDEARVLIEEEERILTEVLSSLRDQYSRGSVQLRTESEKARSLTSRMVATRRDEEKQLLASDEAVAHRLSSMKRGELKGIDRLLDKPYFARIVLDEETPSGQTRAIEYKLGLEANVDCRIVDWRKAPISKLYYEYREGEEYSEVIQGRERLGRIAVRHKLDIEKGELKRISCRFGDFIKDQGRWQASEGGFRSRSGGSYSGLPDVLSLITAEQFRAITEEAETAVLIQGVAGSGKTTVALHRLAWLLHEENSDLKPEDALIIVRSPALRRYIEQSLPSAGISGVAVKTYTEWAEDLLRRAFAEAGVAVGFSSPARSSNGELPLLGVSRLKRSAAMLHAVEEYAADQQRRLKTHLESTLPWDALPAGLRAAVPGLGSAEKGAGDTPLQLLNELDGALRSAAAAPAVEPALQAVATLRHRMQLYLDDLQLVLQRPDQILKADETRLLDAELVRDAWRAFTKSRENGSLESDDVALLLRLVQLKRGPSFLGRRGPWKQIVVDEVQDFSPVELATIIGAAEKLEALTLAGDAGQEIHETPVFPGWEKLRRYWEHGNALSKSVSLTVSYRSTLPIMRFADYVAGSQRTKSGRSGKAPLWYKCLSEDRGVREAIGWLTRVAERYPGSISAVICRNPGEARYVQSLLEPTFGSAVRLGDEDAFSFEEGILVTDVVQAKGLEFPFVLLWNPSSRAYPESAQSRNLLYVAVTRAEEGLCLVSWGNQSPLLPHPHSKLLRLVEEELEEEEEETNTEGADSRG